MGKALRKRVFESYDRIMAYKNKNNESLKKESDAPIALAREAVALYGEMANNQNNSCLADDKFRSLKIRIEQIVFPGEKPGTPTRRIQSL